MSSPTTVTVNLSAKFRVVSRNAALLLALCMAYAVLRIGIVTTYANSMPFSDEWDAVMALPVRLMAAGKYSFSELFRPHNEHTIAPTRLVYAIALWLNQGQFDNMPIVLLNAVLFAAVWAIPVYLFFRHAPGRSRLVAIVFGIVGLAPIDGSYIIFGFQNQFLFLIAGSILTLWFAARDSSSPVRSHAYFAISAAFTCVCMGSGFFAPVLGAAVCAWRATTEPDNRRAQVVRVAIGFAAGALGLILLLHTKLVSSNKFDFSGFLRTFSCLAWPYGGSALLGFFLTLPVVVFAVCLLRRRGANAPLDYLALGLAVWSAAQAAAVAFDRHATGYSLASRYLNVMLMWPMMGFYSVTRLVSFYCATGRSELVRKLLSFLPIMIGAILIAAVAKFVPGSMHEIAVASRQHREQAAHVARYVRSGDKAALYQAGDMQLPYPDTRRLQQLLDESSVRRGLPTNLRAPLKLEPDQSQAPIAFVPNGVYKTTPQRHDGIHDLGSHTEDLGNATIGEFRSRPLHSQFPYLVFSLAGYLPSPGLSLQLDCSEEAACTKRIVRPPRFARESWQYFVVRTPGSNFRVVARDESKTLWFAFSSPLESGRLSVFTAFAVKALRSNSLAWIATASGVWFLLILYGMRLDLPVSTSRTRR